MASSDKNHWLAYCKAIKAAVGVDPGSDHALFFAGKAQKGPLASALIPEVFTNAGIFNIGDNLLPHDSMFYVPSSQHSYSKLLNK
jgi:hypothetical protein